jgi:circadian clock protein KaiC
MPSGSDLELLVTGSVALDGILGGGIPVRSVNVIAGLPGTGKTLCAIQMLFHFAREGRKSLYFTTISEPAVKLLRYIQCFAFFDELLLDEFIRFVDISATLTTMGAEVAMKEIIERTEQEDPAVVVIDSFKAVGDLVSDRVSHRRLVYDLAVQMATWGATTFLVGEYGEGELMSWPEFAIADGILALVNREVELTAVRELSVLKLRGANYLTGRHFLEITPAGVKFFPRVHAPPAANNPSGPNQRVTVGVPGLDAVLDGGLLQGSSTVVQGATGTGKTLFGLHYLLEGVRRGEPGVLFTLEETPAQLHHIASAIGLDLSQAEAADKLRINHSSPVELLTDRYLSEVRLLIKEIGARRVVIDSLTTLALGVPSERRFKELVYSIMAHMRTAGVTLLATMEIPELLGSSSTSGYGISFAADNIVQLRYCENEDRLDRALIVIKTRGSKHATELYQIRLDNDGMRLGEALKGQGNKLSDVLAKPSRRRGL